MKNTKKLKSGVLKKSVIYLLSLFAALCLASCGTYYEAGDLNSDLSDKDNLSAPSAAMPAAGTENDEENLKSDIKVHFIDVGQGDASFIELPDNTTLLIDAANAVNGEQIVSYIRSIGYDKIDFVVATHPHADHIGGMAKVISSLDIGKMYMPRAAHTSKTFENLLDTIENENIDLHTAKSGVSIINKPKLSVDIISPVYDNYENLNNYSAVVKIRFGDTAFLFMGDAEREVEESIASSQIDADVLKVGHHGSNTSSSKAFIDGVSPKIAVISCGRGNSYGHPHNETIMTLSECGAQIYRTDEAGTITVTADSEKNITVDKNASPIKQNAPPEKAPKYESADDGVQSRSSAPLSAVSDETADVVYVTNTGSKYHRDGCSYLKKSKNEITLSDALKKGYEPCSKCRP